jgi:RecA/RadA recombinase
MPNSTERAQSLKTRIEGNYGVRSARVGRHRGKRGVISSGIMAVDYMTGIGGWERGHLHEVFGPTTIGKTSIFGFGGIRGAQELGLVTAVIAVEPRWSDEWAERHGVDPDTTVVLYPDHLEEAFEMLRDIVYGNEADFILFDSLGGGSSDKEITSDKGSQAYGNAALITNGVKRVVPRCFKDNITVLFLNQVRQKTVQNSMYYDSPGGEALRHAMMTRIQVKPGKNKYNLKMATGEGNEDVMVGRDINAVFKACLRPRLF